MAQCGTQDLIDELLARVRLAVDGGFQDRAWSVYNLAEVETRSEGAGYPWVAVAFEGASPAQADVGKDVQAKREQTTDSVLFIVRRFSVIVGVEYQWADVEDDQKRSALDLLDTIRPMIRGYKGVNDRPWQWVGEGPTSETMNGAIFYAQLWETKSTERSTVV